MPVASVKYAFGQGSRGWSETYFLFGANADPDLNVLAANRLAVKRAGLLPTYDTTLDDNGNPVAIKSYTIANTARARQAANFAVSPSSWQTNKTNPVGYSGQRAAKITLYTAGKLHRRILLLRGIPEAWASFNLDVPVTESMVNAMRQQMEAFLAHLVAAPVPGTLWAIRSRAWVTPAPFHKITGINVDGATGLWVLTIPGSTLKAGDKIKVRSLRGPSARGINGQTLVVSRTGNDVVINKFPFTDCGFLLTTLGTVSVQGEYEYTPIKEAFFSGWADRLTGATPIPQMIGKAKSCCK